MSAAMNAIEYNGHGGSGVIRMARRPVPEPTVGEALIRVAAAGVNRPDILQRAGNYPPPPGASDIPGLEVAGTVVANGPGSGGPEVGARVMALVSGGGYAEYCAAPFPQILPVPQQLSDVEAAGVPETFFTVWTNVFQRCRLGGGETFLVHGGASGIGTTAIQLANARGARVFATAGAASRCRACEALGAERAFNYRTEDVAGRLREMTGGRGVDVILDMAGGDTIRDNIGLLAVEGRLCFIAFLEGSKAAVDFLPLMMKRATVTGSTLRPRPVVEKGAIADELRREVLPLLESGRVRPVIHEAVPFAEAARAQDMLDGDHVGKVVLTMA